MAFACHAARELHARADADCCLELREFTCYHAGRAGIETYKFLPHDGEMPRVYPLSAEQRERKVSMLREYKTQATTLAPFMSPCCESFRRAPKYDFRRAPHQGKLFYENFNWGVDGATWRELAGRALRRLEH